MKELSCTGAFLSTFRLSYFLIAGSLSADDGFTTCQLVSSVRTAHNLGPLLVLQGPEVVMIWQGVWFTSL